MVPGPPAPWRRLVFMMGQNGVIIVYKKNLRVGYGDSSSIDNSFNGKFYIGS